MRQVHKVVSYMLILLTRSNIRAFIPLSPNLHSHINIHQKMAARTVTQMTANEKNDGKPINIHWFRNGDLRLHDNPALTHTISSTSPNDNFLAIYCFDPRVFSAENNTTPFGFQKFGVRRAQFLIDCVTDLRTSLKENGNELLVAYDTPENVIEKILCKSNAQSMVCCQEEVASEELAVDKSVKRILKKHKGTLKTIWGSTMYDPLDLPYDGGFNGIPDVFTPFRNKVEKNCDIGKPLPSPKIPASLLSIPNDENNSMGFDFMPGLLDLGYTEEEVELVNNPDERGVMKFKGGESAGLARVKDYIWDKDLLKIYFDTRNGMIGPDYSTKFSPWLAHGCLSPRYIASQCAKYEEERVENKSTYWVVFELLWRDFFKFFAAKHGNDIFKLDGTLGRAAQGEHANSRRWGLDKRHLMAWKEGRTGYPLVDANMRELEATGFMSNRGRQNVCSFLVNDMNTDWRYGAALFEQELLDYDIYSNWGNWCSGAGMTGGRLNRFNVVKQGKDYDCNGEYVKLWIPELKTVPRQFIHEPWKMSVEEQEQCGVKIGRDYPAPLVKPTTPRNHNGGAGQGQKNRNNGNGKNRGKPSGNNGRKNNNNNKNQSRDMKSLKKGKIRLSD